MQCLYCGGPFEWAGPSARCMRCLNIFSNANGQLTPVIVKAPDGTWNPGFNDVFAQNLGFGPPPPGAQPRPPPENNLAKGQFDMGDGYRLQLKVDGKTPENFLKDKASGMIWGWIIGGVILVFVVLGGLGLAGYIYYSVQRDSGGGVATGTTAKWDGKSTFECKGSDVITLSGITATVSGTAIKASANCQLTLVGVNITAPNGIEATANAKVNMTGGSIKSTGVAISASNAAVVSVVGTTVSGKVSKANGGQVNGVK
jgi:hypothetical protein